MSDQTLGNFLSLCIVTLFSISGLDTSYTQDKIFIDNIFFPPEKVLNSQWWYFSSEWAGVKNDELILIMGVC